MILEKVRGKNNSNVIDFINLWFRGNIFHVADNSLSKYSCQAAAETRFSRDFF